MVPQQSQHPRFALIASAVLLLAGFVFAPFYDKPTRQWPAIAAFFSWFLAFGYFLIWVVYRKRKLQRRGLDAAQQPSKGYCERT